MATLRLQIKEQTIYEGPAVAVPRAGEDIHHDGEIVRIEAVVWDYRAADAVTVTLLVGGPAYTF
jgi:hypothetical protein